MKTDLSLLKTTKKNKAKVEIVNEIPTEPLSLDQIEKLLEEKAQTKCSGLTASTLLNDEMERLEKLANFKLRRLQLKALEQANEPIDVKPLEVHFISSNTEEQKARLERIDGEILASRTGGNNA